MKKYLIIVLFVLFLTGCSYSEERTVDYSLKNISSSLNEKNKTEEKEEIVKHIVKSGDTLSTIAKKFNVSVNSIILENNITASSIIKIGDVLVIPTQTVITHTVKSEVTTEVIPKSSKEDSNKAINTNELIIDSKTTIEQKLIVSEEKIEYYSVVRVVDGDTIRVNINGVEEVVRLIGIDTPEIVDPRKTVECFGKESSDKAKELLNNKKVRLENDPSQNNRDIYNRLLRYVYLENGLFFNEWMIKNGYAFEYTYIIPYKYQAEFKSAQKYAELNKAGLWADGVCDSFNNTKTESAPLPKTDTSNKQDCVIKGNINSKKERIYHLPGCASYNATVITEHTGERWFCTEQEALNAGWRKALNCW